MNRTIRTIFFTTILISVSTVGAYSQDMIDVIEQARAIKFLESDQNAVRQLLHEMVYDGSFDNRDDFTYGIFDVDVFYSTGECDEDEDEIFQADKGKVIRVVISSSNDFKIEQLGFSLSKLKKEQTYFENESNFIYHDKKVGIAIQVYDDEVEEVILFPSVNSKAKSCDFDKARDFVKKESWFGNKKLEDRTGSICINVPASVTSISLDTEALTAISSKHISIATTALDPDNDPLVYNYTVSAGRIQGTGAKVVWDLTGVPAGTYTITAGVDDGCGICGQTVTKTVTVK